MFDFMFPIFTYDESRAAGSGNPGGGMATKQKSLHKVLSERYFFNWITSFEEVTMPILIIDPLVIRIAERNSDDDDNTRTEKWIEGLENCRAKKILYCSEMEIARWSPRTFQRIFENVDVVTANTNYQRSIIWTLSNGSCYPYHLCDPIDDELFAPATHKKNRIFSAGRISKFKNTDFLTEAFKEIKKAFGNDIETAYFGNAEMWGEADAIDNKIASEIKTAVDLYLGGINRAYLARLFGESLIYVSKTRHDVYSSTHAEILAAGCISLGGGHPVFRERPGIDSLTTPSSYVKAIGDILYASDEQIADWQAESREYIEKHCGFEAFHKQLKAVLETVR